MDHGGFIELSNGGGPPRGPTPAGKAIPPPPPPPPPPPQHHGGPPTQGRPNIVNVNPGPGPQGAQVRVMQPQQPQHILAPPPPPREIVPVRLQQGPLVQLSDIRKERLTADEAREELSSYSIFRLEKADSPDSYDDDGERVRPTWGNVYRTEVGGISKKEAARQIHALNERTRPIGEKKALLNSAQQRQLEKVQEELSLLERDPRFQTVLVQMDHQLKRKAKSMNRGGERGRDRERGGERHGVHKKDRRLKEYRNGKEYKGQKEYWGHTGTVGRHKSSLSKDAKRAVKERVSITAYYKRSPRPDVDPIALVMQRDAEMARRLQPPHPQQVHPPQQPMQVHPQQQPMQARPQHQQPQQGRPPTQASHNPQPMPMGSHPAGIKGPPQKTGGPAPVQIVKGKQPDQKFTRSKSPSHSRISGWSDSDYSSENDDMSIRTPTSSNTSSQRSSHRYRHDPKKGGRYIEEPGHYGVRTRIEPHNSHGLVDEHRISDEFIRGMPPAPAVPRFAPLPLPPVDLEQIKADCYDAGRAAERAETHERVAEQLARPRIIQRQRQLSDWPAHHAEVAMIEEERPRPRLLQRHPSIRIVQPGNVDLLEVEALNRMERLRVDDERRYEEPLYPDEYDEYMDRIDRQRVRDMDDRIREDRIREELAREDEIREDIARERDREYRAQSYVRRRQPAADANFADFDPANPFAPRSGMQRRVSVSYPARRYDI